jgi:hypothetical protein
MGYINAAAMAAATDLTQALTWHLQSNHYPPVPVSMVAVCEEAIDAILANESNSLIDLPDGISWRGQDQVPAWAIAEGLHLGAFIESCLDYPDDD